ncbi:hypothetical protein BgiMline_012045 [Biomphalaria glabrata]
MFFPGLLSAVAREIFNQNIDIVFVSSNRELVGQGRDQEHVIFHVSIPHNSETKMSSIGIADDSRTALSPAQKQDIIFQPVTLNKEQFATAFPYHLIFDEELRLLQYGKSVARLSPVRLREGIPVNTAFTITYPRIAFTVENVCRFINAIFILTVVPRVAGEGQQNQFSMKGQMIWLKDTRLVIFVGSPRLTSLKEMKKMNIYMADIPLYDVTREMVLLYQQRSAEIDITKELDETTAELKRMSRQLELEKQRTEKLLYQMLPEKVANQLKNGEEVEAEKFDQVTVLFSDIVNFTTIAAACSPMEVVSLLNELYHRFDKMTNKHSVYKVETIGDAYMVVSGVPDKTDKHAQRVADFALDMVSLAAEVLCPDTKKPLQIRVGLHTGPVVAGVVGVKMPRYCLFGDTVNTASRMESNSVPGRIHVSETTFRALQDHGYMCRCRGDVNIKGKGVMKTYFLIGSARHTVSEPLDSHVTLTLATGDPVSEDAMKDGLKEKDPNSHRTNGYIREPQKPDPNNPISPKASGLPQNNCPNNDLDMNRSPSPSSKCNDGGGATNITWCPLLKNTSGESADFKDNTSDPRHKAADLMPPSISSTHIIKGAHLCWGVSAAAQASVKHVSLVKIVGAEAPSRYGASIKDRRINDYDVGRFPAYSKTCTLL